MSFNTRKRLARYPYSRKSPTDHKRRKNRLWCPRDSAHEPQNHKSRIFNYRSTLTCGRLASLHGNDFQPGSGCDVASSSRRSHHHSVWSGWNHHSVWSVWISNHSVWIIVGFGIICTCPCGNIVTPELGGSFSFIASFCSSSFIPARPKREKSVPFL